MKWGWRLQHGSPVFESFVGCAVELGGPPWIPGGRQEIESDLYSAKMNSAEVGMDEWTAACALTGSQEGEHLAAARVRKENKREQNDFNWSLQ
jgi:hypothetical protein